MTAETWKDYAAPRMGPAMQLRQAARNAVLSLSALAKNRPQGKFLRPIYCHYVFDEQREAFERKLRQAQDWGDFVDTPTAVAMARADTPIDGSYFHLSFDDGLHCLLRNAADILERLKIPSISFVNSSLAGEIDPAVELFWRKATNYRGKVRVMTWDEMREISSCGMEIGAHTRSHRRLVDISSDPVALQDEIVGCKRDIEENLDTDCRYFAWPFGRLTDVDDAAIDAVRAAGFEACFGVYRAPIVPGKTDMFRLPRHHFEAQWPHAHFRYFAAGGMEK